MSDYTVSQGDAFHLLSELPDNYAHAAIVDYPWEFSIKNGTGRYEYEPDPETRDDRGKRVANIFSMEGDDRFIEVVEELERILVDGAWLLCMADDRFQDVVRRDLQSSDGFIFRRNWAWTPGGMGMGAYGRVSHYPIPVATNGETERYVRDRGTLYEVRNGRASEYPTGKPPGLYRQLLKPPVLENGERLLEPFCGSAPGADVAASRGLDYWGCDVDGGAVELARDRFRQDRVGTGQQTL